MKITAMNLSTGEVKIYVGCTLEQAAMSAHAQSKGDNNTWQYQARYGHLVKRSGVRTRVIGDWAVCGPKGGVS